MHLRFAELFTRTLTVKLCLSDLDQQHKSTIMVRQIHTYMINYDQDKAKTRVPRTYKDHNQAKSTHHICIR